MPERALPQGTSHDNASSDAEPHTHTHTHMILKPAICGLLLLPAACGKTDPSDNQHDGTGDDGPCEFCDGQNDDVYQCYYMNGLGEILPLEAPWGLVEVCANSQTNAVAECENLADNCDPPLSYNNAMDAQIGACHELPATTCVNWNPSVHITYSTGTNTYEIDGNFVDAIIANPALLTSCDDARFDFDVSAGAYYVLDEVSSGDLADELGLQNGDRPLSVNGMTLQHWDDVADAFFLVLNVGRPSSRWWCLEVGQRLPSTTRSCGNPSMVFARTRSHLFAAAVLSVCGCPAEHAGSTPEKIPTYQGEHIVVTTDYGPLCAGTLAEFDAEIERIDAALGLESETNTAQLRILGDEAFDYCMSGACVNFDTGRMYMHFASVDGAFSHEAVHQRVNPTGANLGKPLFNEGLAVALARPQCFNSKLVFSMPDAYIIPASAYDLPPHAYYLGGELANWLIETRGAGALIDFMNMLEPEMSASQASAIYDSVFGSSFAEDLVGHLRPRTAQYEPWELGCNAPEISFDEQARGYVLVGSLDCESERVRNDFQYLAFGEDDRAFVEWSLVVDETNSGYFTLAGEIDGHVSIRPCGCIWGEAVSTVGISPPPVSAHAFEPGRWSVLLPPSRYLVTWRGHFDDGIDASLALECTPGSSSCPTGTQCSIWHRCEAEADELAEFGQSCEVVDGLRTCVEGSRCVGGICLPECDVEHPCPLGDACGLTRVCGPVCDLLAQDCANGWGCVLSSAVDGTGQCVPQGAGQLLDPCHKLNDTCSSGFVCGSCGGSQLDGCCVPFCESDTDCPPEVPECGFAPGATVGICV